MLRAALRASAELPPTRSQIYAAHVVAAAVTEALADGSEVHVVFDRMIALLDKLHGQNPAAGPLSMPYRGDLCPRLAFRLHSPKLGWSLATRWITGQGDIPEPAVEANRARELRHPDAGPNL